MPTNKDKGPHSKTVNEGGKLTNLKFASAPQPNLDLKSDPNNDVMRAIKGLKFTPESSWGATLKMPSLK